MQGEMDLARPASYVRRFRRGCLASVIGWTLPGSAGLALLFIRSAQPMLPEPPAVPALLSAAVTLVGIVLAVAWTVLPIVLLAVGNGYLSYAGRPGWRWHAAWSGAMAAGVAFDPLILANMNPFDTQRWPWIALSIGYLAVGAMLIGILIRAKRAART